MICMTCLLIWEASLTIMIRVTFLIVLIIINFNRFEIEIVSACYNQCGSNASSCQGDWSSASIVCILPSLNSSSSEKTGAIIGGAIGACVFLLFFIKICYTASKRRKDQQIMALLEYEPPSGQQQVHLQRIQQAVVRFCR